MISRDRHKSLPMVQRYVREGSLFRKDTAANVGGPYLPRWEGAVFRQVGAEPLGLPRDDSAARCQSTADRECGGGEARRGDLARIRSRRQRGFPRWRPALGMVSADTFLGNTIACAASNWRHLEIGVPPRIVYRLST